ncbi:ran-binding protein 9-like isoform X1 [Acanthaster planci]|uniref:Ran-binding protein 9-like isoform X1 n=2 Tax=Acanthaster planci TaxID=133434 RepID=A0A8B7YMJ4_ACAPL|nr:ran-binding protein 9-like isoform X1 [Acanthaster planci]
MQMTNIIWAKMATRGEGTSSSTGQNNENVDPSDRLKQLYPAVNEEETPLPRIWNSRNKSTFIGLSQNNLRVHYKGVGKTHKDAASVTTAHPIPASTGIYYFEVTIISKGRDGYMGIGLSTEDFVNNMNRLPGWDKHSYGYHGDNGHTFNSAGNGQPYGPTFTTGDVVGCGVNLIDNTCFYTKNGVNLGVAFTDLPSNLYPTVGLQTPGEIVDTNFGQNPFVFNIDDLMQEMRMKTCATISRFPVPDDKGEWQTTLHRMVSTYLVHHGYCSTAECFARCTGQTIAEELTSIKNRQKIQRLVLDGRMGEAIETTQRQYPGLLEKKPNLEFMLKCRQFVEMVNGTDSEIRSLRSPRSRSSSRHASPAMSPHHESISLSSTSSHHMEIQPSHQGSSSSSGGSFMHSKLGSGSPKTHHQSDQAGSSDMNSLNGSPKGQIMNGGPAKDVAHDREIDMDVEYPHHHLHHHHDDRPRDVATTNERNRRNGAPVRNGSVPIMNGSCPVDDMDTDDIVMEPRSMKRQLCGGNLAAIERMLSFGRELQTMYDRLCREVGRNDTNQKALQDAFSLLAYSDPWNSPVGYQLDPVLREPVCAALNSAILELQNMPKHPLLELAIGHTMETMKLMSKYGPGSCAFTSVQSFIH